jgi:hypothetical protein
VSVSVTTNRRHPQQAQVVRRDDLGLLALVAMISNGQWSIVDQTQRAHVARVDDLACWLHWRRSAMVSGQWSIRRNELKSSAWTIWACCLSGNVSNGQWSMVDRRNELESSGWTI